MRPLLAAIPLLLVLAACDGSKDKGVSISIGDNADTNAATMADPAGKVALKLPGIDASVSLPKMDFSSSDIDIDGMALYPGSRVTGVSVHADDADGNSADSDGEVRIAFASADPPAKLLDYYRTAATKAGFTVAPGAGGEALTGRKDSDKGFALTLAPDGAGSKGTMLVNDK